MTHAERMAALVEAGEKLGIVQLMDNCENMEGHLLVENGQDSRFATFEDHAHGRFYVRAANARPTIALAAEGMKALKEWRECERKMNNVSNNTNDYQNAYNALGAAWRRIDKLLAQWEEGT